MRATFGNELKNDLRQLQFRLERWSVSAAHEGQRVLNIIGIDWRDRAKERIPVSDTENSGRAERSIQKNVYSPNTVTQVLEVGGNVDYLVYIEFGTKRIAGGQVLALGDQPEITDAMAITEWAAKEERLREGDSSADNDQQMPWLRPAWAAVEPTAIELLNSILEPPDR